MPPASEIGKIIDLEADAFPKYVRTECGMDPDSCGHCRATELHFLCLLQNPNAINNIYNINDQKIRRGLTPVVYCGIKHPTS